MVLWVQPQNVAVVPPSAPLLIELPTRSREALLDHRGHHGHPGEYGLVPPRIGGIPIVAKGLEDFVIYCLLVKKARPSLGSALLQEL